MLLVEAAGAIGVHKRPRSRFLKVQVKGAVVLV
jgi:hypothetical protein